MTSTAPAISPRGTGGGATSLALRLLIAGALVWLVLWGVRYSWRSVKAEYKGGRAEALADREGFQAIAMENLREAIRLAPESPENITRRAVLAIKAENQKARVGSYRAMSRGNLSDALDALESTRLSTVLPSNVERKLAEVNSMLSGVAAAVGEQELSKQYAAKVADHSLQFLALQGKPFSDQKLFYESAIRRSYQADRHDLVLYFYEHCQKHFPGVAEQLGPDLQVVNRSRLALGESPVMISDTARRLSTAPGDARLLGDLILAGTRYGQAHNAALVLELLNSKRPLPDEVRQYLDQLRRMAP